MRNFVLTTYVPVDEVGKRYSVFYLVGSGASAFAGILAYGVSCAVEYDAT
jgi:hypothetical protein